MRLMILATIQWIKGRRADGIAARPSLGVRAPSIGDW
jgi:hypothetical protein